MSKPNVIEKSEDTIDLRELFFAIIAQWKVILLCVFISLCCAILYLRITPDVYSVNALTQIEDKKGASAALMGELSNLIEQKSPAQAEIEILQSRLVLGQVINNLHLDVHISSKDNSLLQRLIYQPEYRTQYSEDHIIYSTPEQKWIISAFDVPAQYLNKRLLVKTSGNHFSIVSNDTNEVVFKGQFSPVETTEEPTSTNGWNVRLNSSSTEKEGEFYITKLSTPAAVSALMSQYSVAEKGKLSGIIQLNYQGTDREHIVQVLNEVLKVYSQQNIERRSAETSQTVSVLDKQLPELKQKLDESERAFNEFRSQYQTVDIKHESELYLTQTVDLESRKVELEQKYAQYSAKYTHEHPAMKEISGQLATVNSKIAELKGELTRVPDLQRRYLQLQREVEVNTQLYTSLLNSYEQLKVAKAGEIGSIRIVDQAVLPINPIKPKKLIILVLSVLVGGFIGILIALAKNLLRSGVRSSEEIEDAFGTPVYAIVPHSKHQLESKKHKRLPSLPILAVKQSDDIAIESLKSIRTALHFSLNQSNNNVLTISGPAPQLGKSFISVNLATILAQDNKKVLIIDADLRRGYLHKYFNTSVGIGLAQYLSAENELNEIVKPSHIENLYFMQRGKNPVNPSELLGSERFGKMLEQLKEVFDYIIIDTPPALAVTDSVVVAQHSGTNLIVARYNQTSIGELNLVVRRFEQANVKVNGFILNGVAIEASGKYGYGYNYNYAYSYKAEKDKD